MRAADPADRAIAAIQDELAVHFADADRQRVRDLRRRISEWIEADLALLDALDGDADFEPSLGSVGGCYSGDVRSQTTWARGGTDDRENAECADCNGELNRLSLVVVGRRA